MLKELRCPAGGLVPAAGVDKNADRCRVSMAALHRSVAVGCRSTRTGGEPRGLVDRRAEVGRAPRWPHARHSAGSSPPWLPRSRGRPGSFLRSTCVEMRRVGPATQDESIEVPKEGLKYRLLPSHSMQGGSRAALPARVSALSAGKHGGTYRRSSGRRHAQRQHLSCLSGQ